MKTTKDIGNGSAIGELRTDHNKSLLGRISQERGVLRNARSIASHVVHFRGGASQIPRGLATELRGREDTVSTAVHGAITPWVVTDGAGQGDPPSDRGRNDVSGDVSSKGPTDRSKEGRPPGQPPGGGPPKEVAGGEDEPEEVATTEQLANLYAGARAWVDEHGSLIRDDATSSGLHKGLPISEHPPQIVYAMPGNIIRQVTPEAAEILGIGDKLEFVHKLPHYEPFAEPGLYQYMHDEVWFNVDKPAGHDLRTDSLIIEATDDPASPGELPEFVSDRWTESAISRSDRVTEDMDTLERLSELQDFEGRRLSRAVGGHLMTKREHQALSEIVSRLDEMRAIK